MSIVAMHVCDACGATDDVHRIVVLFGAVQAAWEAELCLPCYDRLFGVLVANSRRSNRSTLKPYHRLSRLNDDQFSLPD